MPTIAIHRLYSHQLEQPLYHTPADIVAHLGAVQAQEYAVTKWSLALRSHGLTDDAIEAAMTDGSIIRTHLLRPTWHFVAATDIRWMLALTAPRVDAINGTMYRKLELDDALFARTNAVIEAALQGGVQLTREALGAALKLNGISADGMRLSYIVMRAELDAVVCSGARHGKHFTYALLETRAPQGTPISRDQALATLTLRYFTSHGPATVHDYAGWSGLTIADCTLGIEMNKSQLEHTDSDEKTYWWNPAQVVPDSPPRRAYLLPVYDEYLLAYRDRRASLDPAYADYWMRFGEMFTSTIVIAGRVVGLWRRDLKGRSVVVITLKRFTSFTDEEQILVNDAAQRFADFLNLKLMLTWAD